ncbi:DUF6325 family protein [Geodermatophilus marinus]|uniref:DUF6325 family protein n=1 Tax=Geodermatophilus sp. LHW52908 TaxID=2303986 RepID=UPI001F2C6C19|nr:DUF6325 family protein [Geodermatophilus sp. LHW52908]
MTADLDAAAVLDEMGPVDYLVVEFPVEGLRGEIFPLLVDLADRGIIRVLDLAFVRKDEDGTVSTASVVDVAGMAALDAGLLEGVRSGLLGPDDLHEAAAAMEPGRAAGVLLYENTWAAPFATACRRAGAQLVASGRIPVQSLLAALEETEPAG